MLQSEEKKGTNLTCAAGWAMSPMIKPIVGRGAFDCGDEDWGQTSAMVNFQSDAMSMVHFSTAMRYRLFLEKLNIAIIAIIFLDHRKP